MADGGIFQHYFRIQEDSEAKYGSRTVVLYELGQFLEAWEYDPLSEEDGVVTSQIGDNVSLRLSMRDAHNSSKKNPQGNARKVAQVLGMNLTSKHSEKPHGFNNPYMVGFPSVVFNLHKDTLLMAGFTVVRVDQTEKIGKVYRREVVGVFSPATELDGPIPDNSVCSNSLVVFYIEYVSSRRNIQRSVMVAGIAQINIMTGENSVCEVYSREGDETYILQEMYRYLISKRPSQILLYLSKFPPEKLSEYQNYFVQQLDLSRFSNFSIFVQFDKRYLTIPYQEQYLQKLFPSPIKKVVKTPGSEIMERLKLGQYHYGRIAYLMLMDFCYQHSNSLLLRLRKPRTGWIDSDRLLVLHNNAADQLDLFPAQVALSGILARDSQLDCLLAVLDRCATPMGSRFLRNRMMSPLVDPETLEIYYSATEALVKDPTLLQKMAVQLRKLPDVEALQRKIQLEVLSPKELCFLVQGYIILEELDQLVGDVPEFEPLLVSEQKWNTFLGTLDYLQKYLQLDSLKVAKLVKATFRNPARIQALQSFFVPGYSKLLDPITERLEELWGRLNELCQGFSVTAGATITPKLERRTKKEKEDLGGNSVPEAHVVILTTEAKGRSLKKLPEISISRYSSKAVLVSSEEIAEISEEVESLHQTLEEYLMNLYIKLLQNLQKQEFFSEIRLFVCHLDFMANNALVARQFKYHRPQVEFCEEGSYLEAVELRHPLVERISSSEYLPTDLSVGKGNSGILTYGINSAGKCFGIDTEIMLADGHTNTVQNIQVGDELMGDDSRPRKVLSTTRGRGQLYRIVPKRGKSFVVNGEHILVLKNFTDTGTLCEGESIEISVNDYLNLNCKNYYLYKVGVDFPSQRVDLDPYLLGYWLGTEAEPCIPIANTEVLDYFTETLDNLELDKKGTLYSFRKQKNVSTNQFMDALRKYNVLNNKHIPDEYLFNDRKTRLAVLAGLIDSNESKSGSQFEVIFKSEALLDDLIYLARSLGYMCYKQKCEKTCTSGPLKIVYYRTCISAEDFIKVPLLLKYRSPEKAKEMMSSDHSFAGFKIEAIGEGDYYGFEVDGNKRFLLDDFTVTHNSTLSKAAAIAVIMAQMGCFVPGKIKLGLFKRIITRLSGADNIHKGHSSFVVEMMELKTILLNADTHSLILGDELSRGTESGSGTGLSVAAIEELCRRKSCFIFATHMHQLVEIPVIQQLIESKKLWIGHLSSVYDEELETMVYDRVLREGSGSSSYGLEILKSLGFPSEFIKSSTQYRQDFLGRPQLLPGKKSRYNAQVYMSSCALCGTQLNLQTHHLQEQHLADDSGFIGATHKNSAGNLLVICASCHQKHHQKGTGLKTKQTPIGEVVVQDPFSLI